MPHATTRFGLLALLLLFAAPAWAQTTSNVTFQVDMNTAITNCALDPATDSVLVRGSFNDWSNDPDGPDEPVYNVLEDGDSDRVFTTTIALEQGTTVNFKFYGGTPETDGDVELGYEDGGDRSYEVTADEDQTIEVIEFFKEGGIADACAAETAPYEVFFEVDMSVQIAVGAFDPNEDIVMVAGDGINSFSNTADTLVQDIFNPDIYFGTVEADLTVPSTQKYKFIIGEPGDAAPDGWEGGGDRTYEVTGDEEDVDNDGFFELSVPRRYFDDAGPEDFLTEEATVTFEVDLRPAYYHLADSSALPSDTQTGDPTDSIDGLFINGPVAKAGDGAEVDWATWGADLRALSDRQLVDDGTKGDAVAGDSIFSITYTFGVGTRRLLFGKFGINGLDNEGGFGADHNFRVSPGTQEIEMAFGAVLRGDGTYDDDNGPQGVANAYDPYILIDNDAEPPTFTVVRRGGEEDVTVAVEPTGSVPNAVVLKGNYPNPFAGSTTFEYGVEKGGHVHLAVYDLAGRRVAVLVDEVQTPDTYRVTFEARDLASGVYVTRLQAGGTVLSQKLTILN